MPRPALKNVSTAALQAEIERRVSKLADLLKLRDDVDAQIADLKTLAGQFRAAVAAEAPATPVRKYRRRKAKIIKVVGELVVVKPVVEKGKRGSYGQAAPEFVLGLFSGGKVLTTKELAQAWGSAGRKGKVNKVVSVLVNAKKLARRKIKGGQGSNYSLVGSAAPKAVAAMPMVTPAAKKPVQHSLTATDFILGLLQGKMLTTRQVNEAWRKAGRGGRIDTQLSRLVKIGKVNRAVAPTGTGSVYGVTGGKAVTKPAAKPVAKKIKRAFTCPTCKTVYDSGPKLGVHYKAEPTHRLK